MLFEQNIASNVTRNVMHKQPARATHPSNPPEQPARATHQSNPPMHAQALNNYWEHMETF